ncbi:MAG: RuBisCO large subunit C-terminal-like domain-containing protein [Anaerolineales bacterium]
MSLLPAGTHLPVSGSRFRAVYQLQGDADTARARALDICIEQTIEYPAELVPAGDIRDHVFGQVESLDPLEDGSWRAVISYADETSGYELPQLVNVLFGNISMKPGIRLVELDLSEGILTRFKGPRFGVAGLRTKIGVFGRPLLATAAKPMGLNAAQLAAMAHELALGGMDIIKDDHGLGDQPFAPFKERVTRTAEAIAEANVQTGGHTLYMPNVTGPFETMLERIHFAKEAGAGGLMLIPGHCGLDFMRRVADDDAINLPIMSHPAFTGSYVLSREFGVNHRVMHGQLLRLAGADMSVFPNYVGRFASYSREDCAGIALGCVAPMGALKPIFVAPGGGIQAESFADMLTVYGPDVAFLMSSNLHRAGPDLAGTVKRFREMLDG